MNKDEKNIISNIELLFQEEKEVGYKESISILTKKFGEVCDYKPFELKVEHPLSYLFKDGMDTFIVHQNNKISINRDYNIPQDIIDDSMSRTYELCLRNKYHFYIRPHISSDNTSQFQKGKRKYIVLDDVTMESIQKMFSCDLEPSMVIESSPDNYQCIFFTENYINDDVIKNIKYMMVPYFKADMLGMFQEQFFRAPESINFKEYRMLIDGTYPKVKLIHCTDKFLNIDLFYEILNEYNNHCFFDKKYFSKMLDVAIETKEKMELSILI